MNNWIGPTVKLVWNDAMHVYCIILVGLTQTQKLTTWPDTAFNSWSWQARLAGYPPQPPPTDELIQFSAKKDIFGETTMMKCKEVNNNNSLSSYLFKVHADISIFFAAFFTLKLNTYSQARAEQASMHFDKEYIPPMGYLI